MLKFAERIPPVGRGEAPGAYGEALGTFASNRSRPIHRWYPFIEGYSAELVERAIQSATTQGGLVLDPFGGSGTTALAAALAGRDSYFCEVNPYLAWLTDVKVNGAATAAHLPLRQHLRDLILALESDATFEGDPNHPLVRVDNVRHFFSPGVAVQIAGILDWIAERLDGPVADLAKLACATSLIPSSNMIRRADLRRRHGGDPRPLPLRPAIANRLRTIIHDVESVGSLIRGTAKQLATDVRTLEEVPTSFELIVTSPPYLNGTNYFRNTKLELLALAFIQSEGQLADLRIQSITAGINNVSSRRNPPERFPAVEAIAGQLDSAAYDRRIPALVRGYFSDMKQALERLRLLSLPSARFFLDIGDSRFANVYVPTHHLLMDLAQTTGWKVMTVEPLRKRRSFDGQELTQVLIEMVAA